MNFMRSNGNWEGRMLVQGLMNNSIFHHLTCNIFFFVITVTCLISLENSLFNYSTILAVKLT